MNESKEKRKKYLKKYERKERNKLNSGGENRKSEELVQG